MSRIAPLKKLFAAIAAMFAIALVAPAASAGDPLIDAAKAAGTVGERIDGYLDFVNGATVDPATRRKVEEINARRRAVYERLANEQSATIEQVAILTGEKLISQAPAGEYVLDASGKWIKR